MSNITILRPTWSGATTAKTFALDQETNRIKTVKSYDLGKFFNYATASVNNITELHHLLRKCEDKKVFRIYGIPVPGLPQQARRLKENFRCDDTNLVLLDADGWDIPKGYSIDSKTEIQRTVQHILVDKMQLTAFKGVQFCCLLSSSSWSKTKLRAHLYFMLDEPVTLEQLHKWGYEHNLLKPDYRIDYSLFRQVQPDFISKRICLGFKDTLLSAIRLTSHCDHLSPYVKKADLTEHFKTASAATANDPYASSSGLVPHSVPIGSSWEKTIEMAGSADLGINEPTYRACAQLVQELGDDEVTANITHHVNRVFARMWMAIKNHGVRGDKADRDLYTREKIKGYITTAIAKKFGRKADEDTRAITEAIAAIKGGATSSVLFTKECLEAIANIKLSSPEKWANVRTIIKRELKGEVPLADLEKAATAAKEKMDLELVVENTIDQFEWYIGLNDNSRYCMAKKENGYILRALADGVEDVIYDVLFQSMKGNVPNGFERNVIRLATARIEDYRNPFKIDVPVENRCYSACIGGRYIAYYNMGSSPEEGMKTAVIDESGFRIVPSTTVPVLWKTATNTLVAPVEDVEEELEILGREFASEGLIEDYIEKLRKYTTVADIYDILEVAGWQVATVLNTGVALLLQITGASNSGKSSTATFVKDLCDPTSKSLRDSPDLHSRIYKDSELAKTLRGRQVTIFDNLSRLSNEEQNSLCMIATGWQYDYRVLYSNSMESIRIRKPVILTSLTPIVGNEDLRSRTVSVLAHGGMKTVDGDGLFSAWDKHNPRMRAGLLMLVSKVIKRANQLKRRGISADSDRLFWAIQAKIVLTSMLKLVPKFDKMDYEDQRDKVQERQEADHRSDALLDAWKAVFAAWIVHGPLFAPRRQMLLSSQDMYHDFREFVQLHAGDRLPVSGAVIAIEPYDLPRDARQFGNKFAKSITDLERVTGWRAISTRNSVQRMWVLTPKVQNLI